MSKELTQWQSDGGLKTVSVTQFWGGEQRGVCLQITTSDGHIQLTEADVNKLIGALVDWSMSRLLEKANR